MSEYSGVNCVVEFATVDISGEGRMVKIEPKADAPEKKDSTHFGSTIKEQVEMLAGAPMTSVTFSCWDEPGGGAALLAIDVGDQGDLVVYPEGKTHGLPMVTVADATVLTRSQNIQVQELTELEATFESASKETRTSYSTAT